ncbi:MAG: phage antirepressor [Actinophytocola sp.]|uniref:BRO family protein n=1 Tax=Actinophytocola sp. TaxID=1872138 RepID=UPI003C78636F
MNDLTPFEFHGTKVRVTTRDGEPWFVAADVCFVLGYSNSRDAVAKHVRDGQKGVSRIATPSGDQDMTVINEGGLYRLLMRARTVLADEFQDWVTDEVLPAIRRTGSYGVRELSRRELADYWARAEAELEEQRTKVAELAAPARSWNQLADASGDYDVRAAAQILSRDPAIDTGQKRLFTYLREIGWIGRDNRPYQSQVDADRLRMIPRTYLDGLSGEEKTTSQLRVTVKGIHELHKRLGGTGPVLLEVAS